jgi:hypothetical protein
MPWLLRSVAIASILLTNNGTGNRAKSRSLTTSPSDLSRRSSRLWRNVGSKVCMPDARLS